MCEEILLLRYLTIDESMIEVVLVRDMGSCMQFKSHKRHLCRNQKLRVYHRTLNGSWWDENRSKEDAEVYSTNKNNQDSIGHPSMHFEDLIKPEVTPIRRLAGYQNSRDYVTI